MFPNIWVEEVYFYDSKVHQRQLTDTEQAEALIGFIKERPIRAIYIDPSACSFKLELSRHNIPNLYDGENEVLDGIRFVSKLLSNGTLKICQNCKPLIKEFQSYCWDTKCSIVGIDKPLKINDHILDSLRYALYTHLFAKEGGRLTAKDIDRNYRQSQGGSIIDLPRELTLPEEEWGGF